jgi:anti-anti-sigma factor
MEEVIMSRELTLKIEPAGGVTVAQLSGFLAQYEVYRFKNEIDHALEAGCRALVVDLAEIDFIDSAGIGSMLQLRKRCQGLGVNLALVMPGRAHVRQTLTNASIDKIIAIHESAAIACARIVEVKPGETAQSASQTLGGMDQTSPRLAAPANIFAASQPSTAELFSAIEELRSQSSRIEAQLERIESLLDSRQPQSAQC